MNYITMRINTTNKEYLLGDFDKDGVPNIDDRQPFNKKNNKRVNEEVSLAKTIIYVKGKRREAKVVAKKFAKKNKIKEWRVKDTYSTINKAVRRNPMVVPDFIGFRVEGEKKQEVEKKWNKFNKKHQIKKKILYKEVGGTDNKYKTNKGTSRPYRAFHSNFLVSGFGAEAQFRTKKYGKLNYEMHGAYKRKESLKPFKKRSKALLKAGY